MTITRDVVNDLLPAYLAGEASADTRRLVDEYLATDADLARTVAESRAAAENDLRTLKGAAMSLPEDHEMRTLRDAKAALDTRRWLFALAVAFALVPFSFVADGRHLTWMMIRDVPTMGILYWVLSAAFWIALLMTGRRLRRSVM